MVNLYLMFIPKQLPFKGWGQKKKGCRVWQPFCIFFKKQKMELPHDYPLSHHQLLFNIFAFILCHKYGNSFY